MEIQDTCCEKIFKLPGAEQEYHIYVFHNHFLE
jgi:hypothetical protein